MLMRASSNPDSILRVVAHAPCASLTVDEELQRQAPTDDQLNRAKIRS